MKIAEYASGDKAPGPGTKEVTFYLKNESTLGTVKDHAIAIVANVKATEGIRETEQHLKIFEEVRTSAVGTMKSGHANIESIKDFIDLAHGMGFKTGLAISDGKILQDGKHIDAEAAKQILVDTLSTPDIPEVKQYNFGPPAQYNSGVIGGGIMQLQQRLNTVAPRR